MALLKYLNKDNKAVPSIKKYADYKEIDLGRAIAEPQKPRFDFAGQQPTEEDYKKGIDPALAMQLRLRGRESEIEGLKPTYEAGWAKGKVVKAISPYLAGVGDTARNIGSTLAFAGSFKKGEDIFEKTGKIFSKFGKKTQKEYEEYTDYVAMEKLGEFDWGDLLEPTYYHQTIFRNLPNLIALAPAAIFGYIAASAAGTAIAGAVAGKVALGAFGKAVLGYAGKQAAGTVGAGLLGAMAEGTLEAGQTYEEMLMKTGNEEIANKAGKETLIKNIKMLTKMNIAEIAIALAPTSKIPFLKSSKLLRSGAVKFAGKAVGVGGMEATEEMLQRKIQLEAMGEEFRWGDPATKEAGAAGAIFGMAMGGAGSIFTSIQSKVINSLPEKAKEDFEKIKAKELQKGFEEPVAQLNALDKVAVKHKGAVKEAVKVRIDEIKKEAEPAPIITEPQVVKREKEEIKKVEPKIIKEPIIEKEKIAREKPIVSRQIALTTDFDIKQPKSENYKKAEYESNILAELKVAEKGEHYPIKDEQGYIIEWTGKKSTFPFWIPDGLRSKQLIDTTLEHIRNKTIPTKANEIRLYNAVADVMEDYKEAAAEVDTEININEIDFGVGKKEDKQLINNKIEKYEQQQSKLIEQIKKSEPKIREVKEPAEKISEQKDIFGKTVKLETKKEQEAMALAPEKKAMEKKIAGKSITSEEFKEAKAKEITEEKRGQKKIAPEIEKLKKREIELEDIIEDSEGLTAVKEEIELGDVREKIREHRQTKGAVLGFNPKNLMDIGSKKANKEIDGIIRRSDIAKKLSHDLNVPIRRGKYKKQALGIYKEKEKLIRYKGGGLQTLFHETGHFIDDNIYNFSQHINKEETKSLLVNYDPRIFNKTMKEQRQEAFAEFLRYHTISEKHAKKLAPVFFKSFEEKINSFPEVKDILQTASQDFKRWAEMPDIAKVVSQISFDKKVDERTLKEKILNTWDKLYESTIDDMHSLDKFVKLAEKELGKIAIEKNPYILGRNIRGWIGSANAFMEKGTFGLKYWKKENGKTVLKIKGKGLKSILQPIEKIGALDEFSVYLVSKRAVELAKRKIKTGIDVENALQSIEQLEKKYSMFKNSQKDIIQYQNDLIDYGQESGLYNNEMVEKMRKLNKEYVPFYRIFEEAESKGYMGRGFANIRNNIKKIRGSDRDIINPIEGIIKNTYTIINLSQRNQVMMSIVNLANKNHKLGRMVEPIPAPQALVATETTESILKNVFKNIPEEIIDTIPNDVKSSVINIFRPAMINARNVGTVLINGKPRHFQIDPDLYTSIQSLEVENVAMVVKLLAYPAKFLRAGATLSPDFMLRNPARDQVAAYTYSKFGYIPVVDLARGVNSILKKDQDYWLWRIAGGENATIVDVDRSKLIKNYKELSSDKRKNLNVLKNPLRIMQLLSAFGEQGTRLGEARKGLNKGVSPAEATFASREITLDFLRIGAKTKAINLMVAFWNANVQGTDKMVRSFKNNPYRTTLKVFTGITLPSILLYFANRDDERWKEIPQWQKNLFWIVMTEDRIYRIPKPFELGIIFGSIPERMLEHFDNKDREIFEDLVKSVKDGAMPGFIPTFLLPIVENISNYSFFLDRDIVSPSIEKLPEEDQYTAYTSEISKILGKLIDYSPAKIDNLMRGYFAGLGQYTVMGIDKILVGTNIVNKVKPPKKTVEELPVIKSFMIREPVGSGTESVNIFYKRSDEATQRYNKLRLLFEAGKKDEAMEYLKEYPIIKLKKYYNKIRRDFSEMSNLKREIRNSDLSPEEKQKKIKAINYLITEYAQKAVEIKLKE